MPSSRRPLATTIKVLPSTTELRRPNLNRVALAALATGSGGELLELTALERLRELLRGTPGTSQLYREKTLWEQHRLAILAALFVFALQTAVIAVLLEFVRGRDLTPFDVGTAMESRQDAPRLPGLVWWAVLTLILLTSVEITLLQWGPDLLRERGGLEAGAASATIAAVVIGMIIGRLIGSRIVERVSSELVFGGSILFAAAAFAYTWLVTGAIPLIIGLVLIGIGIGMHFPLGIGRAMRASLGQPDRAAGWTSAGIGVMSGVAPFALAALADSWGVHKAFVVMLAFFAVSVFLRLWKRVPEDVPA